MVLTYVSRLLSIFLVIILFYYYSNESDNPCDAECFLWAHTTGGCGHSKVPSNLNNWVSFTISVFSQ